MSENPVVAPLSPCIQVCRLDANQVCEGCFRTRQEITEWVGMSATEQQDVVDRARQRCAERTA